MTDRAARPVFWPAVGIWAAGATGFAAAVSRGEIQPAVLVEAPVLAAMLAFIVVCQAFPVGEPGVLRRLVFLLGAAVGQVALCVVLTFVLMPLWYVSPFLGVALGCVIAALPFVLAAMGSSVLFVADEGETRPLEPRVGPHLRAR